ncbi:nucleosome assembly protein 1-like 1 isoform X1 [Pimephales promelas]|uniref:nucleosome assembly protein 1-like 1 isoform X1 n=1 Tax=Pimephales promelas TaxID=90988 RepID=UPI0019554A2C|nr:nucleosome assembly protein 1-like 1 isoform X1 [Pimephales promelas]
MADLDNKDQTEMDPADIEDVEEVEEEETGEDNSKARQLTMQMMQNPQILAALQERLDGLVGSPSGYMESLPKVVKRRVNALKNLQVKCAHIEAKFYEEVHELERKYAALYQPLFDKRSDIVRASYEPTDEECEWKQDEEEELTVSKQEEMKEKAKVEEEKKDEEKEDPKGIPEFWLTVFKNVDLLSEMLQEHDEPILKHLQDIKVKFSDAGQPMSFTLEFHFEPNDFFTQTVLTKTYKMRSEPDESDPFSFDGPEIMGCTGCTIDWSKGKNVTLKTIKKKQKHKGRGTVRTVTKTVPNDSFFNFFSPLKFQKPVNWTRTQRQCWQQTLRLVTSSASALFPGRCCTSLERPSKTTMMTMTRRERKPTMRRVKRKPMRKTIQTMSPRCK